MVGLRKPKRVFAVVSNTKEQEIGPARRVVLFGTLMDDLMRGIGDYAWRHLNWQIEHVFPNAQALRQLADNPPDGMVGYFWNAEMVELAKRVDCPCVNYSGAAEDPGMPLVTVDNCATGRIGADYFVERGFSSFGFVGDGTTQFSSDREEGFLERLYELGHRCSSIYVKRSAYPTEMERSRQSNRKLAEWVADLPESTAVMAANDAIGWWVEEAAREVGKRIPEDLAVLGVDNMALSNLCNPPLSSVVYPGERIGTESAKMLDQLMCNEPLESDAVLVLPDGIVTRHSTDVLAVKDVFLARALRYISEHYASSIRIDEVARAAATNRRTLEQRFRAILDRSPVEEIRRVRIEKARALLINTDYPIDEIADMCGFASRRWFNSCFQELVGMTPARFRKERRA